MNEKITVIIPFYNTEIYLEACIENIRHQTYTNLEILLINDGSTDASTNIAQKQQKLDKRITYISWKENKGIAAARQEGIEKATGEFVMFMDSDDTMDLNTIEVLYTLLKKHKADISFTSYNKLRNGKKIPVTKKEEVIVFTPEQLLREIIKDEEIGNYQWGHLYKKEVFHGVQYPLGKKFEDIETLYKIVMNAQKIVYDTACKYNYLIREDGICGSADRNKEDVLQFIDVHIRRHEEIVKVYPSLETISMASIVNIIVFRHQEAIRKGGKSIYNTKEMKQRSMYMRKCIEGNENKIFPYLSDYTKMLVYMLLYDRKLFQQQIEAIYAFHKEKVSRKRK